MCAVVDADVAGELFRGQREPIPERFYRWMTGRGRLLVGGKQWQELTRTKAAKRWLLAGIAAGRVQRLPDDTVSAETVRLEQHPKLRSNDAHVLAVAAIGRARLLYTNDTLLEKDFKDAEILAAPEVWVYKSSPVVSGHGAKKATTPRRLGSGHKRMLGRDDLCPACD